MVLISYLELFRDKPLSSGCTPSLSRSDGVTGLSDFHSELESREPRPQPPGLSALPVAQAKAMQLELEATGVEAQRPWLPLSRSEEPSVAFHGPETLHPWLSVLETHPTARYFFFLKRYLDKHVCHFYTVTE